MALSNTVAARGLINPRLITGGTPDTHHFEVSSTYSVTFMPGQLVKKDANGFVEHYDGAADFTGGVSFLGVSMGYLKPPDEYSDPVLKLPVVTDLRNTLWEIQSSVTSTIVQTGRNGSGLVGRNFKFLDHLTSDMDTTAILRKQSKMRAIIEGNSGADVGPLRCLGMVVDKDNSVTVNPRIVVQFNEVSGMTFYQTTGQI